MGCHVDCLACMCACACVGRLTSQAEALITCIHACLVDAHDAVLARQGTMGAFKTLLPAGMLCCWMGVCCNTGRAPAAVLLACVLTCYLRSSLPSSLRPLTAPPCPRPPPCPPSQVLALEMLILLLENPSDDSVEMAVDFCKEVCVYMCVYMWTRPAAGCGVGVLVGLRFRTG